MVKYRRSRRGRVRRRPRSRGRPKGRRVFKRRRNYRKKGVYAPAKSLVPLKKFVSFSRRGNFQGTQETIGQVNWPTNDLTDVDLINAGDQELAFFRRFALNYSQYRVRRVHLDIMFTTGQQTAVWDATAPTPDLRPRNSVMMLYLIPSGVTTIPSLATCENDPRSMRRVHRPGTTTRMRYTWTVKSSEGSNWSDDAFLGSIDANGIPDHPTTTRYLHFVHTPFGATHDEEYLITWKVTYDVELFNKRAYTLINAS